MTDEEILEKVKRDYPKGTIFESALSGDTYTSSGEFFLTNSRPRDAQHMNPWYLYDNKWAKIIKSIIIKEEVINNYEIF